MRHSPHPLVAAATLTALCLFAAGCAKDDGDGDGTDATPLTKLKASLSIADPPFLNVLEVDEPECPPYEQQELKEPVRVSPVDGVLETQLVVAMKTRCVPIFDTATKTWSLEKKSLRTYGYSKDLYDPLSAESVQAEEEDSDVVWSAPGPTFVLHKATAPGVNDGTNFKMTLYNILAPQADPHACDTLERKEPNPQGPFHPDTSPNCFHGDNSTNFHFHGFHVSPQPGQDWVGLELLPYGSAAPDYATHGVRGEAAIGSYDFDVDRLRYTQAEGTHWYHAHKHGSTALQVLNGLVGTFIIRGAFDDQLEALFESQGGLPDRLLVVQQLQERPSGLGNEPAGAPEPLINGQADPIIKMRPGEIQRWRFVGATMQASAQLEIGFESSGESEQPEVKQIAMDGVQFAPANYACQPILAGPDCESGTEDDTWKDLNSFTLDPGSRIDLLVKAPATSGTYTMTYEMPENLNEVVVEGIRARAQALVEDANATLEAGAEDVEDPPLLTLVVEDVPGVDTPFPTEAQFPKMPAYLADLEGPFEPRTIDYQMANQFQLGDVHFSINDKQYDPACVDETLVLDVEEEWTLRNDSDRIAHPFHIHTNPFQVVRERTWNRGDPDAPFEPIELAYDPPYVWRDVVAIPTAGSDGELGEAVIRYVGREFTGEFVNHCHILGHEDRGMMQNVQVTCANGKWGKPTSDLSPECVDGNYIDAAPKCE